MMILPKILSSKRAWLAIVFAITIASVLVCLVFSSVFERYVYCVFCERDFSIDGVRYVVSYPAWVEKTDDGIALVVAQLTRSPFRGASIEMAHVSRADVPIDIEEFEKLCRRASTEINGIEFRRDGDDCYAVTKRGQVFEFRYQKFPQLAFFSTTPQLLLSEYGMREINGF